MDRKWLFLCGAAVLSVSGAAAAFWLGTPSFRENLLASAVAFGCEAVLLAIVLPAILDWREDRKWMTSRSSVAGIAREYVGNAKADLAQLATGSAENFKTANVRRVRQELSTRLSQLLAALSVHSPAYTPELMTELSDFAAFSIMSSQEVDRFLEAVIQLDPKSPERASLDSSVSPRDTTSLKELAQSAVEASCLMCTCLRSFSYAARGTNLENEYEETYASNISAALELIWMAGVDRFA